MKNSAFLSKLVWFKLLLIITGFILTIVANISDMKYDAELRKKNDTKNLNNGHQIAIRYGLIALVLLFSESLMTSSLQIYFYKKMK